MRALFKTKAHEGVNDMSLIPMVIAVSYTHLCRRCFFSFPTNTNEEERGIMKKVLAVILAALMILSCTAALAEGTFRVGMECNYCLLYTSRSI